MKNEIQANDIVCFMKNMKDNKGRKLETRLKDKWIRLQKRITGQQMNTFIKQDVCCCASEQ